MLHTSNVIIINFTGFIVTFGLLLHLFIKLSFLDKRVIKLSIGIDIFFLVNEKFEAFGKAGLGSVIFGKRTHNLRLVNEESGINTMGLNKVTYQFVKKS